MNLTSPEQIKKILENVGGPVKRMGQNFLIDSSIIDEMIKAGNVSEKDEILEIGPGIGSLTEKIIEKGSKVVCVEKDSRMMGVLKKTLPEKKNLTLLNQDILNFNTEKHLGKNYKILSNLPFYISSPVIRKFSTLDHQPSTMILIIQKALAERMKSKGNKMNFLSVLVHFQCDVSLIKSVPRTSFWPAPKVDGQIIKLSPHSKYSENNSLRKNFFKVVEAGFLHPRKQIKNNLSFLEGVKKEKVSSLLKSMNLDPKNRAEDFTLKNWVEITKNLDFDNLSG